MAKDSDSPVQGVWVRSLVTDHDLVQKKKKITGFAVGWLSTNEKAWRRLGVCCFCLLLYSWDVAKLGPLLFVILFVKFSSVAWSYPTLCDPRHCSMPASLSITNAQSLLKLMSIESGPSKHLIFCHPPLLLPSVFSSESILHIRWPKYWSFSFSTSPFVKLTATISKLQVEL